MRAQQSSRGRSAVLDLVAMRVLRETWRRESRERPAVARLVLIAVGTLSVGVVLAGSGLALLGELIAGLALLPLSLAVFFRLLPPPRGLTQPTAEVPDPEVTITPGRGPLTVHALRPTGTASSTSSAPTSRKSTRSGPSRSDVAAGLGGSRCVDSASLARARRERLSIELGSQRHLFEVPEHVLQHGA